jgi:hypothetical protein
MMIQNSSSADFPAEVACAACGEPMTAAADYISLEVPIDTILEPGPDGIPAWLQQPLSITGRKYTCACGNVTNVPAPEAP